MLSWKKVLFTSANLAKNWVHEGGKAGTPSLVETMPYSSYVTSLRNLKTFDVSSTVFRTRWQARLSGAVSMTYSVQGQFQAWSQHCYVLTWCKRLGLR